MWSDRSVRNQNAHHLLFKIAEYPESLPAALVLKTSTLLRAVEYVKYTQGLLTSQLCTSFTVSLVSSVSVHVHHPRLLVRGAIPPTSWLTLETERWLFGAASMLTPFAHHIYHAWLFVHTTEHSLRRPLHIEARNRLTLALSTQCVDNIHHARLPMDGTIQALFGTSQVEACNPPAVGMFACGTQNIHHARLFVLRAVATC